MTRASTSSPAAPGAMLGGKLRLDREIGRGAMGVVYDATDVTLGRRAAVKVMSRETIASPDQLRRFEREARAAAALTSEHAVRIHEVGSDPVPYLVMELLRGRTLEAIVGADGPPSVEVALGWMLEALDAIAEAHAGGFVHRDVKPGNLFLAERPGHPPTVKVLDFGLVKSVDPTLTVLTATGTAMGTPAYMAPEQIRAAPDVDARADVWAIGVTLFELLTGALPFPGETVPDLVRGVLDGEARDVRELRPDVPEAVAAVVARCLTKPRDGRFESGAAVARALVGAMGGTADTVPLSPRDDGERPPTAVAHAPRPDRRAAPRQAPATPRAVPPTRQNAHAGSPRRVSSVRIFVASALAALVVGGLAVAALVAGARAGDPTARAGATVVTSSDEPRGAPPPPLPDGGPAPDEDATDAATIADATDAGAASVDPVAAAATIADAAGRPSVGARPATSRVPAHRPVIHAVEGIDPAERARWSARVERDLEACAVPQPCVDAKYVRRADGRWDIFHRMAASSAAPRLRPGCDPEQRALRCALRVLDRHAVPRACVPPSAACEMNVVVVFD